MAPQTVQASQAGINKAELMRQELEWTQEDLAEKSGASRNVVINFLKGRPVRLDLFKCICQALEQEADWKDYAWIDQPSVAKQKLETPTTEATEVDIEQLVKQLREQVAPLIQHDCGEMKVLDMTYPIDSTAIYTDVNILERVRSKSRADLEQLMQGVDSENFDRFCLGQVREERVPGLEALARHRLLMILGKPGAGKTTFLKRLAMWCKAGKQGLAGRVPIFVTLKDLADDRRKHETLIEFVVDSYGLTDSAADLEQLLKAGRALVLLDGLDEVQNSEHDRVLAVIREFGRLYGPKGQSLVDEQVQADQNQIVITCRIAAQEYIFERFTEVEVADFRDEQIQDFANKWFLAHEPDKLDEDGASTVGQLFWQELEQSQPVKELATNPLLLTLLCLEFGEDCGFPSSRAELYERGLEILFTKWDGNRQIKRDQVYKKLPVTRKKALLAQLAWTTFEQGDYFFKQAVAGRQIQQYIQNLPGASEDEEALLLDSAVVLQSIEAQHGLLTQRAVGIYSFSHLTFQEYFSASYLCNQLEIRALSIRYMHELRWREVFLILVEKLDNAGEFLLSMESEINSLIKDNKKIKKFLSTHCLMQKWEAYDDKLYEVRAFWGNRALNRTLDVARERTHTGTSATVSALRRVRSYAALLASAGAIGRERDLMDARRNTSCAALPLPIDIDIALDLDITLSCNFQLDKVLSIAIQKATDSRFRQDLESLYEEILPIQRLDWNSDAYWYSWNENRWRWAKKLQKTLGSYRHIGHNWQLTEKDIELLAKYYYGSKLLIDCLNSECYVSRDVRRRLEDNLLVPPD